MRETIFEELEEFGCFVPITDRMYPRFIVHDFEATNETPLNFNGRHNIYQFQSVSVRIIKIIPRRNALFQVTRTIFLQKCWYIWKPFRITATEKP